MTGTKAGADNYTGTINTPGQLSASEKLQLIIYYDPGTTHFAVKGEVTNQEVARNFMKAILNGESVAIPKRYRVAQRMSSLEPFVEVFNDDE